MKFINVSALAEQLNMNVEVVWKMVQEKLFEKGCMWADGSTTANDFSDPTERYKAYHEESGIVICINDKKLTYGEAEWCCEYLHDYHSGNFLQINITDFDITQATIVLANVVQLSGEYTKEQLQEILNNMEE